MVLLDDVVQVLDLPDLDGRFPFSVEGLEGGQISAAFVHGNSLRSYIPHVEDTIWREFRR
jgi:hypothetical protein